jgi:hypothetical protein
MLLNNVSKLHCTCTKNVFCFQQHTANINVKKVISFKLGCKQAKQQFVLPKEIGLVASDMFNDVDELMVLKLS